MKIDYNTDYIYKYSDETYDITFSFSSVIPSGETLSSCDVTISDDAGNDKTSVMISGVSISSPNVTFTIADGTADTFYTITLKGTMSGGSVRVKKITCEVIGNLTLNAKVADPNANSYVTLEEATKYIRNKFSHSNLWDTLTIEGKKRVLIEAARVIDTFNFNGDKYYDSQSMQFPRDDHETVTGNPATPITATAFQNTSLYSDTYGVYPDNYWKYGAVHITTGTPLNDIRQISSSDSSNGRIVVDPAFTATPTTNTEFIVFAPIDKKIKNAQCEQAEFLVRSSNLDSVLSYKEIGARVIKIGDTRVDFDTGNLTKLPISPVAKKLVSAFIRKRQRYARA